MKHAARTLLLLIALTSILAPAGPAAAQVPAGRSTPLKPLDQFVHDRWGISDGLPQNGVSELRQTQDGYVWFGTQEGLVRFDGVRFRTFDRTNTKGMNRSWVAALRETRDGSLYIFYQARDAGFAVHKNGSMHGFTTADGLRNGTMRTFAEMRDSSVWFIHGIWGATRFKDGVFTSMGAAEGLPSDTIGAINEDAEGRLWVQTPGGLFRSSSGSYQPIPFQQLLPGSRLVSVNRRQGMFCDRSGSVWVATTAGLIKVDGESMSTFTTDNGLLDSTVSHILQERSGALLFISKRGVTRFDNGSLTAFPSPVEFRGADEAVLDRNDILWIGSLRGLWRLAHGAYDSFDRRNGLTDEEIFGLMVDAEQSIWFGTQADGLHRLREGKFATYGTGAGLKDPVLTSVLEDSKGDLWFGSVAGGVARLRAGTATVYDESKGFPRSVDLICEGRDGTMWFGSREGLYRFRNGTITRFKPDGMPAFTDPRMVLNRRNGQMVIADAATAYTLNGNRLVPLFTRLPGPAVISTIAEDTAGHLWIGTFMNGLFRFDGDSVVQVGPQDGFTAPGTYGVFADAEGAVWVGTPDHGLFLFRNGRCTRFTPESGLFDYNAANIIADDRGSMWFSDNKGIYRISRKSLIDFAEGRVASYTYDKFGTADGMKSQETNFLGHPNVWKLRDGRIMFPTIAGAAIVDPASITLNPVPPRVVIEGFAADKTQQDLRSAISLAPGTSNLELAYVGLSFIGSDRIRYRYRLEGFDKEWVDPGNRTVAYYTHPGPGDYTFRVIAANADGVWDTTGASLAFEIRPHFYESRWFYAFAFLGFVFGGPSVYYLRVRQLKRREAALARQVDARTVELRTALENLKETQNQLVLSEKMASLGQLTAGIAHEIKNPLNFITNFAVLSGDLARDLREELAAEQSRVDPRRAVEIKSILDDLEQNVQKINEHGKRADSIVRGMLLHSRGKKGERQETDLNALLAEYTNLAYHGMRAQDTSFNIKIETDLDAAVGRVSVVPQDLSRAFLNIVNNACYAAHDRKRSASNGFMPVVRVSARAIGDAVEIRVRDNGNGIPQSILDKIFNPFFTTKPAGAGTGLGLSLSYDIITQVHKGTIRVDTKEGEFTEFILTIPRNPVPEGEQRA